MSKERNDLNREQAWAYREQRKAEALAMNLDLKDFVLAADRENDVATGMKGPRRAIVALVQKMAAQGATYGQVLGQTVPTASGKPFKIAEGELLGYVCANGYCTLTPPKK